MGGSTRALSNGDEVELCVRDLRAKAHSVLRAPRREVVVGRGVRPRDNSPFPFQGRCVVDQPRRDVLYFRVAVNKGLGDRLVHRQGVYRPVGFAIVPCVRDVSQRQYDQFVLARHRRLLRTFFLATRTFPRLFVGANGFLHIAYMPRRKQVRVDFDGVVLLRSVVLVHLLLVVVEVARVVTRKSAWVVVMRSVLRPIQLSGVFERLLTAPRRGDHARRPRPDGVPTARRLSFGFFY